MKRLTPLSGMNNVAHDDEMSALGNEHLLKLRDAMNVDISASGRISIRRSGRSVTDTAYKNLWQSPLHKDVFATLGNQLVRINPQQWTHEVIGDIASTGYINYEVINNLIYISDGTNIYTYDGNKLQILTIETPPKPYVNEAGNGALGAGDYVVAISWVRDGLESGLSESEKFEISSNGLVGDRTGSSLEVTLPYCFDQTVDSVNVYVTTRNGSELRKYVTIAASQNKVIINQIDDLGRSIQFSQLSPMSAGKFMAFWQGRLFTADRNIIKFSQALNFHLCDERYDFIAMPQRITFLQPVDGGIWVGQVDHVVFLMGDEPKQLSHLKKPAQAPVPFSAIQMDTESLGELAQGGKCAIWLSEHGYVVGTSNGLLLEPHANQLKGITAKSGQSVRLGQRVVTVIS